MRLRHTVIEQDEKRREATERKQAERKRDERLGMKPFCGKLAEGERTQIEKNAKARGFTDKTEYLYSLVMADTKELEADE